MSTRLRIESDARNLGSALCVTCRARQLTKDCPNEASDMGRRVAYAPKPCIGGWEGDLSDFTMSGRYEVSVETR